MIPFLLERNNVESDDGEFEDFAKSVLRRKRRKVTVSKYKDMSYALPTSNDVERFFSRVGRLYSDDRHGMDVVNLEAQIFLNINAEFWNEQVVHSAMNIRSD